MQSFSFEIGKIYSLTLVRTQVLSRAERPTLFFFYPAPERWVIIANGEKKIKSKCAFHYLMCKFVTKLESYMQFSFFTTVRLHC